MNHHNSNNTLFILLLPVSLLFVIAGVTGLIENLSPTEIDNFFELSKSFYQYFEYHLLIFLGALLFVKVLIFILKIISQK